MKYNNFSILIDEVMIDYRLSAQDKIVYMFLVRIQTYNNNIKLNQEHLCDILKISKKTLIKSLDKLDLHSNMVRFKTRLYKVYLIKSLKKSKNFK